MRTESGRICDGCKRPLYGELKVIRGKRKYGKSKYNASRIFNGMVDFISIMFMSNGDEG